MVGLETLGNSGITCVRGIKALGKNAGIKASKKDFAVLYSEVPANLAAVFTKNTAKAAPLILSIEKLKKSKKCQAISVVSGVANAGTGKLGLKNAKLQTELLAKELGIPEKLVFVNSTGIIGKQLPMDKIAAGMNGVKVELSDSFQAGVDAVTAIMTTDKVPKFIAVEVDGVKIAGMVKGAGMVYPNMATLLCFIFTDALVEQKALQAALKIAVEKSFNSLSVDGCMSTNDTVMLLANGLSGRKLQANVFQEALDFVCLELAKKVLLDAEGSTKVFSVEVSGAKNYSDAKQVAMEIVKSDLVKAAVYGNDPNWGRILQAIGQTNVKFSQEKLAIFFDGIQIVEKGLEVPFDMAAAQQAMRQKNFQIRVSIGTGKGKAIAYGCDLTEGYVKENAKYTT